MENNRITPFKPEHNNETIYPTPRQSNFPWNQQPTLVEAARIYHIRNGIGGKIFSMAALAAGLEVPATFLNDLSVVGVLDDGTGLFTMAAFGTIAATAATGIIFEKLKSKRDVTPSVYNQFMAQPLPLGQAFGRYITGHGKTAFTKIMGGIPKALKAATAITAEGAAAVIPGSLDDLALVPLAASIAIGVLNYRNPFFDNPEANKKFQTFAPRTVRP